MRNYLFIILFSSIGINTFCQQTDRIITRVLSHKILPAIGYNEYDGLQLGVAFHNIEIPRRKFTYYAIPVYATGSKRIAGHAGLNYQFGINDYFKKAEAGINVSSFSILEGNDLTGKKIFGSVSKADPYLRLGFPSSGDVEKWIEFRSFIIGEKKFNYAFSDTDSLFHPFTGRTKWSYLNQLTFNLQTLRELFPYDFRLQLQQAESFYRINASLDYFFNYLDKGGVQMRLSAVKFGYIGAKSELKRFETLRYQPKLTAVRGDEDYTYSNYFFGRNEFEGLASHQVMMRDGGMKLRTDVFQDLQGRSDNWIASMNLNTTLPAKVFPEKIPLKIFLDIGTYAGAWRKENADPRFLYVAGLQLSLLKNLLNIYAPVIYSKKFKNELVTVPDQNKFFNRISFSIDVHRFKLKRIVNKS